MNDSRGGWGGSARVWTAPTMVVGDVVRVCGRRCSGVRWLELMLEVDCDG
jgi:hypothetical protein